MNSKTRRTQQLITGAFRVNKETPYPWNRAISSGIAAAIPIFVGIAYGHFAYGLVANMGGFAYLYASNEPYARRGIQLLLVILGLALSFALGSLGSAGSVWTAALVLGVVGAVAVFLCEALDVPPPSALFFILACAMGTSMPTSDPAALLMRVGLIIVGGIPAWLIAMSGWVFEPHGPETKAVQSSYRALASWLASVGTDQLHRAQHNAAVTLRSSEKVLAASSLPIRRPGSHRRLIRLNALADNIFLAIIELSANSAQPVEPKLIGAVRAIADAVDDPDRACCMTIPKPLHRGMAAEEHVYRQLCNALAIACEQQGDPVRVSPPVRRTVRAALGGAWDRNSLIVPKAARFGAVLLIAYLIAYAWQTQRPYWVFFSAAAVMMGPTATATVQRALQRTAGTVAGTFLSAVALAAHPSPMAVAFGVMVLQALAQLMIVRNYALTVAFITPLGLVLAHAGHPELTTNYLVTARLVDILLGCVLGLAGSMLFGQPSAAKRLAGLLSDALRGESRLVEALLTDERRGGSPDANTLRTTLVNLRVVYDTAASDLTGDKRRVESLWPTVVAVQRLGFFLIAVTDHERRQHISKQRLTELKAVFDELVNGLEAGRPPTVSTTPATPEYPVISQELNEIAQGLQVLQLSR